MEKGTCPAMPLLVLPIMDMTVVPTLPQGQIWRRGSQVSGKGLLQMLHHLADADTFMGACSPRHATGNKSQTAQSLEPLRYRFFWKG